jgi:hypothetical protein
MKTSIPSLTLLALTFAFAGSAQAAITIYGGATVTGSSAGEFNGSYVATNLVDGTTPTEAAIGTNFQTTTEWALANATTTYLGYDLGSAKDVSGFVFNQRATAGDVAQWENVTVWKVSSNPGTPVGSDPVGGVLLGAGALTLSYGSVLNYYDFGTTTNGQYFVFKFSDTTGTAPNAGGANLFMAVPEPSTYALFGGLGMLGLVVRRRLRRRSV